MACVAPWQMRFVMVHPTHQSRQTFRAGVAVLAAGVALFVVTGPLHAQQNGLRGEVREDELNRQLLLGPLERRDREAAKRKEETQASPKRYQSEEEQADPGEGADRGDSLFSGEDEQADPFNANNVPVPQGRPRSAREEKPEPVSPRERKEQLGAAHEAREQADEDARDAIERAARLDAEDNDRNARVEPEGAAEPIQGIDRDPEENPYAPLGMRLGSFNVITTLEQGLTATDNANYSPTPKSAILSESTLRLNATSDWSRHSATINAFGTYRKSISGEDVDDPSAGIDGTFNLDISHDLRGVAKLGYNLRRETADSPVVLPPNVSRPLRHQITGSAGVEKDVGKFRFAATAGFDRLAYGDADSLMGPVSQEERNSTLAYGTLRAAYEISPAITPFAELEIGRRNYDLRLDTAGYARSSDRLGVRAGVELDLAEKLTGELSAGWISEDFDDNRLVDVSGLSTNANLVWSPERGTTVNLNASTTVEGTTNPGESGSLFYALRLGAQRDIRSNLTAGAELGLGYRDYVGKPDHDLTLSAETSLTWWLNRYAGVKGRYRYEQTESTLPNRDTRTNSVYLGLVLQR